MKTSATLEKTMFRAAEQNTGALKLYQRNGFQEIDRAKVVPHPLIHHTGDILLMTAPVQV